MMDRQRQLVQRKIDNFYRRTPTYDVDIDFVPSTSRTDISQTGTPKFILTEILKKFKKGEILPNVHEVINFSCDPHLQRRKKSEIIDYIVQTCENLFQQDSEEINDISLHLHLKYIQHYNAHKQWSAMKIVDARDLRLIRKPEQFEVTLARYININNVTVKSIKENGALWTVLFFDNSPKPNGISYMLMFPGIPLVIYNSSKVKYLKGVKLALRKIFQVTEVEDLQIKEKNLTTVCYFAHKACESENVQPLPPDFEPPVKLRKTDDSDYHMRVVNEDASTTIKRKRYLRESFGDNVQPTLHASTFNVKSNFYGFQSLSPGSVNSRVLLKGNNLLEGLHDLVNVGAMKYPLPKHLTDMQETGQKVYWLNQKNRHSTK